MTITLLDPKDRAPDWRSKHLAPLSQREARLLDRRGGLAMTDFAFLFGMFLVILWALDPWRVHIDLIPGVKHFPVVVVLGSVFLAILGVMLRDSKGQPAAYPPKALFSDFKYLLMLSLYVIAGSLAAKYLRQINETFLTMGVFTLAAPMTAWFILNSRQPATLLKLLCAVYVVLAMLSAGLQLANFRSEDLFHQREHLVIPMLGVMVYFFRGALAKLLGIAVIVVVAVSASKITAYITGLATVALLLFNHLRWGLSAETNPIKAVLAKMLAGCILVLSAIGLYVLYNRLESLLPSGNPRYRLHMYELAFDKFLDSPIWGVGFSESAVTHFDLFQVALSTQNLPTHSDPLDIAANGGVIGLCLWLFGLLSVLWPAWVSSAKRFGLGSDRKMIRTFYGFLFLCLTGVLVSVFNPILNLPNQAWAFWASLGALAAFARLDAITALTPLHTHPRPRA